MMKKRQGCLEYNSAFTLIEVMLAQAIVSVVLIAAQRPLLEFHQIVVLEQQEKLLHRVTFNVSFCGLNQC